MAGALAERLEAKHNAEITFPVTHFGNDQSQACRDWLSTWPHGAILCKVTAPSWSRASLSHKQGPRPLRSSTWPWGLPDLDGRQRERCDTENAAVQNTLNMIEVALKHTKNAADAQRPLAFAESEDFGPRGSVQPASIWRLKATKHLVRTHGLMRSAAYQCEFGKLDRPQPIAILHNYHFDGVHMHKGWPRISVLDQGRCRYEGPLPSRCNCNNVHIGNEHNPIKDFLSAPFVHVLVEHLLINQFHHWRAQDLLRLGETDGQALATPLTDDAEVTDLDVDGDEYCSDFAAQDQFVPSDVGLGDKFSSHDFSKNFVNPPTSDALFYQHGAGGKSDDVAIINHTRSAMSVPDLQGTWRSGGCASDSDGQCSPAAALVGAGPVAVARGRATQGGFATSPAVACDSAPAWEGNVPSAVRLVERPRVIQGNVPPVATADRQVRVCSPRARPTGSLSAMGCERRTRKLGNVPFAVAPRGLGNVPPASSSRVSPLAPTPSDVPRGVSVGGSSFPQVPTRPVVRQLELSSAVRLSAPTGRAAIRTPQVEEAPQLEAGGGGGGADRARIPSRGWAMSLRAANGAGGNVLAPRRKGAGSPEPVVAASVRRASVGDADQQAEEGAAPPSDEALREAARANETHDDEDSSDTTPDEYAQPKGSGLRGQGPTLTVGKGLKKREIIDGGGLCSPGRWRPRDRPFVKDGAIVAIRAAVKREVERLPLATGRSCEQLVQAAASGELKESPFSAHTMKDLLDYMHMQLDADGDEGSSRPHPGDVDQPIRVRLLQALLRRAGDPDVIGMQRFAVGVPIGVDVRLPRTPAVYPRKARWSLESQKDPLSWNQPWGTGTWRENYASTVGHEDEIARQQADHVARGLAEALTESEVSLRWPNASIASLGALEKHDANGVLSVRLLFDGTTGVDLNGRIRVRDQEQTPGAPDIKCYQREQARQEHGTWGLTIDVKDAHRTVQIRPEDWRHQLCRARKGGEVIMYKCGVFGIASISYWWSRLASAVQRAVLYLADSELAIWALRVADDFKVETTSARPAHALLFVLAVLQLLGVPVQWLKLRGGRELDWVGYHLKLDGHQLGLSASRARWVVDWCRRLVRDGAARIGEMREGLGRLAFVAGALEYERPFLAPLYAFLGVHVGNPLRPLPVYVLLALQFIASRVERRRHYPSAVQKSLVRFGPRVDARAEGSTIGIGGWLPACGPDGRVALDRSRWFMIELDRKSAPWAYLREGQPFRTIAALEAYGTLIGAKVLLHDSAPNSRTLLSLPGFTDNRGNSSALSRLSSTKFPLCCIAMELSVLLERRGMQLDLEWTPREMNTEADRLSNGDSRGFNEALRVHVNVEDMGWEVLDDLLASGAELEARRQAAARHPAASRRKTPKPKQLRLRARDPW